MKEGLPIEAPKSDVKYPVKESWFRANVAGNALIPQSTWGLTVTTFAAVVNDPPTDWVDFAKSRFSRDQKKRMGVLVSHAHMANSVPRVTKPYMKDEMGRLMDSDLQWVWQYQTLPPVTEALLSFGYGRAVSFWGYGNDYQALKRTPELDELYSNPDILERARKVGSASSHLLLHDPEILDLARTYRNMIKQLKIQGVNFRTSQELHDQLVKITSLHRLKLSESFPKEELEWLVNK